MIKRFMIETSTADKEFNFISETIGSRLVLATTAEGPEVELEVVKGKGKDKSTETVNLEELIDIKGWKALGNRLSQFKVVKVNLVQEDDAGPVEEGIADIESEASESEKETLSPKKKELQHQPDPREQPEKGEQTSLFENTQNQRQQPPRKEEAKGRKAQPVQQSLFPESNQSEKSKKEIARKEREGREFNPSANKIESGREFGVGETIELEI
jgi:topoisomerase-4 subunit A